MFAIFLKLNSLFLLADTSCQIPKPSFFFLPPWWEYLKGTQITGTSQCSPAFSFPGDIWAVGLALIDILLRVAGYAAIIAVTASGVQYIFAGGNPEKAASARRRIYNSIIGLAIVAVASAAVAFIGKYLVVQKP